MVLKIFYLKKQNNIILITNYHIVIEFMLTDHQELVNLI